MLWCMVLIYGVSFVFVIEVKYKKKSSDVLKVWFRIFFFQYKILEVFLDSVFYSCQLIGIEIDYKVGLIKDFEYFKCVFYFLGFEDNGLLKELKN